MGGNLAKEVGGGRVETSVSRGVVEYGEHCAGENQSYVLGQVRGQPQDLLFCVFVLLLSEAPCFGVSSSEGD